MILAFLRRQRRAVIAGGAGTGKTLIAFERAVKSAQEGFSTLLLCYNRGLADHLRELARGVDKLDVATFHQVCKRWSDLANKKSGRDLIREAQAETGSGDHFEIVLPHALTNAIDILGPAYDAIIVDEAQDFGDEFWFPVEMLLNDYESSLLYIFLDENQDVYRRSAKIPVKSEPMILDRNCRNTDAIHEIAYQHYRGAPVIPPGIPGLPIVPIAANDLQSQSKAIGNLLTHLISKEGVSPHRIAILLCDSSRREECEQSLKRLPVPSNSTFGRLEGFGEGVITVDSVARFKGLERSVVILWAFDPVACIGRETLYVGMSRAKSALYLCGNRDDCSHLMSNLDTHRDGAVRGTSP